MTTNRRLSIRVSTLTAMTITASLLNPAFTPLATADVHSTFGLAPRDGVAQTVADNTPALAWASADPSTATSPEPPTFSTARRKVPVTTSCGPTRAQKQKATD